MIENNENDTYIRKKQKITQRSNFQEQMVLNSISDASIYEVLSTRCGCIKVNCLLQQSSDVAKLKSIIYHSRSKLMGLNLKQKKNCIRDIIKGIIKPNVKSTLAFF